MAEAFNLNNFLREYQGYRLYKSGDKGIEAANARDIERAESAVLNAPTLLSLTLKDKIGIGPKVVKQIGETAANIVKDIIDPFKISEYLEKYENVFDGSINVDLQSYAKQTYFSYEAMKKQALSSDTGSNVNLMF